MATIDEFNDAKTVIHWLGDIETFVIHDSLINFMKLSVTGDRKMIYYTANYSNTQPFAFNKYYTTLSDANEIIHKLLN